MLAGRIDAATLARSWRELVYVALCLPLGLFWAFWLMLATAVGVGLSFVLVGIPMLVVVMLVWRRVAGWERERAALVLGAPIAPPYADLPREGAFRRVWARLRDRATWKDLGWIGVLATAGAVAGLVLIALWSTALVLITLPVTASTFPAGTTIGDVSLPLSLALALGGLAVAAIAVTAARSLATGIAALARALLGPDVEEQVARLEHSRASAVGATDTTLRRIERDLHDGAQHRLVAIALDLGRAREKMSDDPAAAEPLIAQAHEEAKRAMVELRDLVRGIHPSILTDRGLDAAVSALAGRSPVPVSVAVDLDGRPPAAAETAAYYVVAEALTNVAKHAGATGAEVRIGHRDGALAVEVLDDGRGGARRAPGSGLDGIGQRVDALDGRLDIDSPAGGPTTLKAVIPCEL
ncbi:MAG TPA: sensor domain-containing protein [Thermoleophilaceae bacterium]|nr:sensor domain-containing protein [Thermoleophilaceae bacterium]